MPMTKRLAVLFLSLAVLSMAQQPGRQLTGKFLFRHLQLTVDGTSTIQSARTLTGSIVFDGAGAYTFTGQQVIGTGGPTTLSGSGTAVMQASGILAISNPQQSG